MNRRISVRAIVLNDNKLLCVKIKPYGGAIPGNYWCLPGGKLETQEALIPALEREMLEETGVQAKIGNLLYIQQFHHQNIDSLEFFFHVTNATDFLQIDLTKTTHGALEISEIAFIEPSEHVVMPEFLGTEALQTHANAKAPAKIITRL